MKKTIISIKSLIFRTVRNTIVTFACRLNTPECVQTAKEYFNEWMRNVNNNKIPKALRALAYCTVIRNGGQAEYDFVYSQYRLNNPADKTDLLNGLACANQEWQLLKFLKERLDNRDAIITSLRYIIARSASHLTAWDFIKSNWNELNARLGYKP
jgi:aminopeptidase N